MSFKSSISYRRNFWFVAVSPSRWCRALRTPRRLYRWWYVRGDAAAAGSFVRLVPTVQALRRYEADALQAMQRPRSGAPRHGPTVARDQSHECGSCGTRSETQIP